MRQRLLAVLVLLLAGSLAFAAGTEEQAATEESTIRIIWWGSQTRHDLTLETTELFEEKNPEVTVEPEFLGWGGYWERLATQAAGGELPDVIQTAIASGFGTNYADRGLLADLDPLIEQGLINVDDVEVSTLAPNVIDGKLYGIPLGVNAPTIAYDPQAFEEAGVDMPELGWTWDDFLSMGSAYNDATGNYFIGFSNPAQEFFTYYLRTQGYSFLGDDGLSLGYPDDQLLVEFWSMMLEMQEQGVLAPPDVASQHTALENRLLSLQRAATTFIYSNQLDAITQAAGRPIELAIMPGPNTEDGMFLKPSMDFAIASNSEAIETAAAFVDFFTNDLDANRILRGERGVPISAAVRQDLAERSTDVQRKVFGYIDLVSANSSPMDQAHPVFQEAMNRLFEIEQEVLYERAEPAEAAARFRREAEQIFERAAE